MSKRGTGRDAEWRQHIIYAESKAMSIMTKEKLSLFSRIGMLTHPTFNIRLYQVIFAN